MTIYVKYKSESRKLSDLAAEIGLTPYGLKQRLQRMSLNEAMKIPPGIKTSTKGAARPREHSTGKNNLKYYRMELGFTQTEVADAIGMKQPYYTQLEKGNKNNPPIQTAYKIADLFGVDVSDIWINDNTATMEVARHEITMLKPSKVPFLIER